ncbi:hypothetical protein UVI_02020410 [Ustilaginoidea virens]|uniref:Uncharacterized protein n=1 Tax=Ustilaginoidea virens TaxID=1159556 RepID=A0A1B5KWY8_USTVR|nr:hypothetical protein UVI_02020410 [Ustilaginoidea virens]
MAAAKPATISASTQNRILIWRSEVASALDDAASSAASSAGLNCSLSDTQSSAGTSYLQSQGAGVVGRGRRIWRRIARRLSGGRFGAMGHGEMDREPALRTAMYRAPPPPPPPVDARGAMADHGRVVGLREDSSSDDNGAPGRGLKASQERLERAARLLDQHHHASPV